MPVPESQLDTWSAQRAGIGSRDTYDVVRRGLEAGNYNGNTPNVFLQGSYCNETNVWSESDVDVVIRSDEFFYHNIDDLPAPDQTRFREVYSGGPPRYGYDEFKADVLNALRDRFGQASVKAGNRAIAIAASGNRRSADVIVAALYRKYNSFPSLDGATATEGICSFTSESTQIINFPKLHSDNCTAKHQATNKWFKPSVRILKNMRRRLIGSYDAAESHAASLLAVAEEGFVERCAELRFPAASTFTSSKDRNLNEVAADAIREHDRDFKKAADKWRALPLCSAAR
jgi:hypothetical protein